MKILVTGAAGFIGSVVTEQLVEAGYDVVAFDNLVSGHREAVHPKAEFVFGDLLDPTSLTNALQGKGISAVCHLAGEIKVDESFRDPGLHFRANLVGGIHLLDAMVAAGVSQIVFSSTAAVYGEPKEIPLTENSATEPVNPYGESKLQFERILNWYEKIHGLRNICLRYFNACGASEKYGEHRSKETHIIPILFEVALGQRERFSLFGTDYPTPDGTCVRDYIHVSDIAQAHLIALENLKSISSDIWNVGTARGYTNWEVIEAARRVTGHEIPVVEEPRRPGDSAILVASNEKIMNQFGWNPKFPDLESMVRSAWEWRRSNPHGYQGGAS